MTTARGLFVAGSGPSTGKSAIAPGVHQRERAPALSVENPIQYDAGVAAAKLPGSTVAGRATVFIFPDLNTGNNTYKAAITAIQAQDVGA